jgi:hypothetical protein
MLIVGGRDVLLDWAAGHLLTGQTGAILEFLLGS